MIGFATLEETRRLGAPVVRLFRVALGHDPNPASLDAFADRLRKGATLVSVAEQLVATDQFRQKYGLETQGDEAFVAAILSHIPATEIQAARQALGTSMMTRADIISTIANHPNISCFIPLLPGLAPGAAVGDQTAYQLWITEYDSPDQKSLGAIPVCHGPLITLVMAVGDSSLDAFARSVDSLQRQIYKNWEMVVAAKCFSPWPQRKLAALARSEPRLCLVDAPDVGDIAASLAHGLLKRRGSWAGILAPGDVLAPTALHEIVAELSAHPTARLLFTDEDRIVDGVRMQPVCKPAYSPEVMWHSNAIGQFAVFETGLIEAVGGIQPNTWPRHCWNLAHRAAETAGIAQIRHIPAILFHQGDTPKPPAPLPAKTNFLVTPTAQSPTVSVIVPTRDHATLLSACSEGVLARTAYSDVELLIVDNGSIDPNTLQLLSELAADPRVRVITNPGPFNFAAMNNRGASVARGDVLVLLNDDTEVLQPDWLGHLVALAIRPDVGAVGAKLLYPDRTVQHAGMLLGPGMIATHVGRGAAEDEAGYLNQLACARDLSAVTGACLATRAAVWHAVGGMDERLAVGWNDVDFCLRVREAGLRVVWTPEALLLHHESASRGKEAGDPMRLARFQAEQATVHARWGAALEDDPFLNANLVAEASGRLSLTMPRRQRPWQQKLGQPDRS